MDKLRVIIVEDEPPVARFVRRIVERENDIVCAVCESGSEALKELEKHSVDVVITDIRMPGKSGLELIQEAKQSHPKLQFIIISSYKNFDYAKEAIQLGVENYIAKPIDQTELRMTLETVRKRLGFEKSRTWREQVERSIQAQDTDAFRRLFPWPYCSVLFAYQSGGAFNIAELNHQFEKNQVGFLHNQILVVFLGRDEKKEKQIYGFSDLIRQLQQNISRVQTHTFLYVHQAEVSSDLFAMVRNGVRELWRGTVLGKRQVLHRDILAGQGEEPPHRDDEILKQLKAAIHWREWDEILGSVKKLLECWKEENASVYYICGQLYLIVERAGQIGCLPNDVVHAREEVWNMVRISDNFDVLYENLVQMISNWKLPTDLSSSRQTGAAQKLYTKICTFLEQNESSNFSLQEISDLFCVSQPYVRKIFKEYSGLSYKEYVLKEKMGFAMEMLKSAPELLIKDVADRVGMEQLYFSTVFRKYVGVTPTQYKTSVASIPRDPEE